MTTYIIRRMLQTIPTLLIVGTVTFLAIRLAPGNPAEIFVVAYGTNSADVQETINLIEKKLGIDKPYIVQYALWLRDVFTGDLGQSFFNKVPVTTLIKQRLPKSIELAFVACLLALPISLTAGVLAAVYRGSWIDNLATGFITIGIAVPGFWLGIMMVILFSVKLEWLPSSGYVPFASDPIGHIKILIMPALTLSILMGRSAIRQLTIWNHSDRMGVWMDQGGIHDCKGHRHPGLFCTSGRGNAPGRVLCIRKSRCGHPLRPSRSSNSVWVRLPRDLE